MYHIHQLNKISTKGTELLTADYANTANIDEAEGILVRSANMHEMHFSDNLLAVALGGDLVKLMNMIHDGFLLS